MIETEKELRWLTRGRASFLDKAFKEVLSKEVTCKLRPKGRAMHWVEGGTFRIEGPQGHSISPRRMWGKG